MLSLKESLEDKSHARLLTSFIQEVMKEKGFGFKDLDAIAVGKGPGSYTGLRIGVSTAKGICFGANLPLIAVSTLQVLCTRLLTTGYKEVHDIVMNPATFICPMIDARRMEVYYALYDNRGAEISKAVASIIESTTFDPVLSDHQVIFIGSGAAKCRPVINHPNALFVDNVHPSAGALATLSFKSYELSQFEDLAYFEPFYLKDFVGTVSKNRLLT